MLECQGLVKRFGDRVAVDGVGFEIAVGETYGLLGPNGAGKTTIISMICGLTRSDAGEVRVAGQPLVASSTDLKGEIGFVPQDVALYPDLTARENLRFFGRLQGLDKGRLAERVDVVLGLIGLADRADDRVGSYSGGMKRRCNIGAALLHQPRLLILDEPTVGVDPQSRNAILEAIEALGGEGLAVLYTTHYMAEAERLCDRVGIIDNGVIIAEGTRHELVERLSEHTRVGVEIDGDATALATACQQIEGVVAASASGGSLDLLVVDAGRILAPLIAEVARFGLSVGRLEVVEPDLEAVFLHLTGKALRDQ